MYHVCALTHTYMYIYTVLMYAIKSINMLYIVFICSMFFTMRRAYIAYTYVHVHTIWKRHLCIYTHVFELIYIYTFMFVYHKNMHIQILSCLSMSHHVSYLSLFYIDISFIHSSIPQIKDRWLASSRVHVSIGIFICIPWASTTIKIMVDPIPMIKTLK